jgi:RNA polymerase sigma-70 factor (ECF subfamily)
MRELFLTSVERLATDVHNADVALAMDEEAFRAFYEETSRSLWAYLLRITGNRQLAEDLLQESYYRVLRARRSYENNLHRRNSLFRIATNLAIDTRRKPAGLALLDTGHHQVVAGGPNVDDVAVEKTDVQRALARLKPRERSLLWLAYAHGASHREIAHVLGLKTGSIKLLLFRARRKMARLLGGAR